MLWMLLFGVMVASAIAMAVSGPTASAGRHVDPDPDSPDELLRRDPSQALAKYGTPADVERLVAEGKADQLRSLGWNGDAE